VSNGFLFYITRLWATKKMILCMQQTPEAIFLKNLIPLPPPKAFLHHRKVKKSRSAYLVQHAACFSNNLSKLRVANPSG
jgi:hypothetical protein